jgi:peptidyl-prolyl cis-trans isomerase C
MPTNRIATQRTRARHAALLVAALVWASPVRGAGSDAVARVNGTEITRGQVYEVVKSVLVGRKGAPNSEEISELTRSALDSLIDLELLHQEALARKVAVRDEEVNAEIGKSRARFASEKEFVAALGRVGMTETELRQDTRKTMLVDRLLAGVANEQVEVTDEEVRAFYDQHPEEFGNSGRVRVRRLLIAVPDDAPLAERSAAWRKTEDLRAQILAGANFAALARDNSSDTESARRGGDMGFVGRGVLPPKAEEVAFSLDAGQLSDVLETPAGYEILQVTESPATKHLSFEEARESIRAALLDAKRQESQRDFVVGLRKKAKIEILPDAEPVTDGEPAAAGAPAVQP